MNIRPAINTINAPWYVLILARIFGKEIIKYEGKRKVYLRKFRGVIYLMDFEEN